MRGDDPARLETQLKVLNLIQLKKTLMISPAINKLKKEKVQLLINFIQILQLTFISRTVIEIKVDFHFSQVHRMLWGSP